MTKNFERELGWFTKRLVEIRLRTVKGYSLPIPFNLGDISSIKNPGTDINMFSVEMTPKEHLEELIEEIRGFYIKDSEKSTNKNDIKIEYNNTSSSAKIFGIETEVLYSFLKKRLKLQTSLFETRVGGSLFYVNLDTEVKLNSTEQDIFAKLRSKKEIDEALMYNEIFEICASHKGTKKNSFLRMNNTDSKKESVARSTISYLLKKIMKSNLFESLTEDQIIKNVRKGGYQLIC